MTENIGDFAAKANSKGKTAYYYSEVFSQKAVETKIFRKFVRFPARKQNEPTFNTVPYNDPTNISYMKTTTDEDDDLADAADAHFDAEDSAWPKETNVTCPISGEAVLEYESAFDFPGAPEATFRKTIAKREMSADDYRTILKSGDEGFKFEGFWSQAKNRTFAAKVRYNKDKQYEGETSPGCEFVFEKSDSAPRVETPTGVMCPKSGKPVMKSGKAFIFPGWPDLICWETIASRDMTAADYAKILGSKDGFAFSGFISKKTNKPFKNKITKLKYSATGHNGKPSIIFDFD